MIRSWILSLLLIIIKSLCGTGVTPPYLRALQPTVWTSWTLVIVKGPLLIWNLCDTQIDSWLSWCSLCSLPCFAHHVRKTGLLDFFLITSHNLIHLKRTKLPKISIATESLSLANFLIILLPVIFLGIEIAGKTGGTLTHMIFIMTTILGDIWGIIIRWKFGVSSMEAWLIYGRTFYHSLVIGSCCMSWNHFLQIHLEWLHF